MPRDDDDDLYEEEFDFVDEDEEEPDDEEEMSDEAPDDADEEGAGQEQEEEPVDEYGRPEQQPANYLVHIYEHKKFTRTIDRPFTAEDAEAFATEFNRTSKPYHRWALTSKNDAKPKKTLD